MDKSKTNDADNSNMSAKPTTLSSPFFVLQMNSHYSPRSVRNIYRSAAISLLICFFIFAVAVLNRKNFYGSSDLVYFMHGWYYSIIMYSAAVLILGLLFGWGLSFLDYHFLIKKSQNIAFLTFFALVIFLIFENVFWIVFYNIIYCVVVLSICIFAIVIYAFRDKGLLGIMIAAVTLVLFSEYCLYSLRYAGKLAYLVLFVLCAVPLLVIAIAKGFFSGSRIRNILVLLVSLGLGFTLLAYSHHYTVEDLLGDAKEQATNFFDPDSQTENFGSNTFVQSLIRKLNAKDSLIGPAQISNEEFIALIEWKYDKPALLEDNIIFGKESFLYKEMIDAETDSKSLSVEFLAPIKYDESYLLSYAASKIGVIPTILLSLALLSTPLYLLWSSLKRKNHLAFLISVGCSLMLLSQTILHFLGNLGYCFRVVPTLPFLGTNIPALGANFALLGLIVACHRSEKE